MEIVAMKFPQCQDWLPLSSKEIFRFWIPKKLNLIPEKSQVSSKVIWISSVILKYKYVVGNMLEFSSIVNLETVCLLSCISNCKASTWLRSLGNSWGVSSQRFVKGAIWGQAREEKTLSILLAIFQNNTKFGKLSDKAY